MNPMTVVVAPGSVMLNTSEGLCSYKRIKETAVFIIEGVEKTSYPSDCLTFTIDQSQY